jgi:hypothetical protein
MNIPFFICPMRIFFLGGLSGKFSAPGSPLRRLKKTIFRRGRLAIDKASNALLNPAVARYKRYQGHGPEDTEIAGIQETNCLIVYHGLLEMVNPKRPLVTLQELSAENL